MSCRIAGCLPFASPLMIFPGSDECGLAALSPAAPEHILVNDTDKMCKTISLLNISTCERMCINNHDVLDDLEDEKRPVDEKPYQRLLIRPGSLQDYS